MDPKTIQTRLSQASWFFFDLDDTLHSFRSASTSAISSALHLITTQHPNLSLKDLQTTYAQILKSSTKSAFTDGKTSHEYRAARFRQLLTQHDIKPDDLQIQALLDTYESTFIASLKLKDGALSLLQALKPRNHKIAILTEGPQDGQERTIEALGLGPFVDYLATTNKLGVAKTEGMFARVLEDLGVRAEEVVVVGDSWERDVVPAREVGITCVWFREEGEGVGGDGKEGVVRIGRLEKLEDML